MVDAYSVSDIGKSFKKTFARMSLQENYFNDEYGDIIIEKNHHKKILFEMYIEQR